jgi:hypothetical protein
MNLLSDEQILSKLRAASKAAGAAGKPGISAEAERAVWAREAMRRGLLGYPAKKKYYNL